MKKLLLGTTALVAAGAFAVAAQADEMMAEPVSVGIGGYTQAAIGFGSDSDDETRGQEIGYVFEFGVSGSTTLDNGVTVGVHSQLGRSAGDDTDFDEMHITMSGSFGSFRIGRTESAAFDSTVAAPGGGVATGVNYVWFSTAAPTVNTYSGIGMEDALKVVYTSPNFNGLSVGLSYAPDDTEDLGGSREISDSLSGHTSVGVNYSTDFMEGGSLTLGAGYEMASDEAGGDDPSAMRFGVNVSIDQISLGGSMYDDENTDSAGNEFDIGASWTEGSTTLGVQYAADDTDNTTMAAAHLNYTLGPGVSVGAQIATGSSDTMNDVTQFMLGTSIGF